jgi:Fic family protein
MKNKKNVSSKLVKEFLRESNAIERVYDDVALEDAYTAWRYLIKKEELTLISILKAHGILMKRLWPEIAGRMRMVDVRVGPRVCPSWELVYGLACEWVRKYGDANTEKEIEEAHVEFEKRHFFRDGNGRVGRLVFLWQYAKAGLPIKIIKADWPDPAGDQVKYYKLFSD